MIPVVVALLNLLCRELSWDGIRWHCELWQPVSGCWCACSEMEV